MWERTYEPGEKTIKKHSFYWEFTTIPAYQPTDNTVKVVASEAQSVRVNCSNPGPVAPAGALRLLRPAAPLCSHWTGDSSQTVSPCGVARLQGDTVKWKKAVGKRYLLPRSQHHHDQKCEERTREPFIKSDLPITGTFRIILPLKKKCRHSHHGRSYATVKLMTLLKGSFWFQWIIPHHLPGLSRTFWIQFYTKFLTAFIMFFKLNGHTFSKYLQKIDKRLFFIILL